MNNPKPKFNPLHLHSRYKAVLIGGSAGSFQGVVQLLASLPPSFPLPVVLTLHRLKHVRHGFVEALKPKSNLPVQEPDDKDPVRKGIAYLAPANYHLSLELGNHFSLSTEPLINNSRPSIDITFQTAAYAYRERVIAILLSGANRDGALGMRAVKQAGGLCMVQHPSDCLIDAMPTAALETTQVDYALPVPQIISFLHELNKHYPTSSL